MIPPMGAPALNTPRTLRLPRSAATVAGNPKIPLPIIEFRARAARLQRPMARTKLVVPVVPALGEVMAKAVCITPIVSVGLNLVTDDWTLGISSGAYRRCGRIDFRYPITTEGQSPAQIAGLPARLHYGRNRLHRNQSYSHVGSARAPGARAGSSRIEGQTARRVRGRFGRCARREYLPSTDPSGRHFYPSGWGASSLS